MRGNHASMETWKFNRMFPPNIQNTLFKKFSIVERRLFWEMRRGHRRPDWKWLKSLVGGIDWIEISSTTPANTQ